MTDLLSCELERIRSAAKIWHVPLAENHGACLVKNQIQECIDFRRRRGGFAPVLIVALLTAAGLNLAGAECFGPRWVRRAAMRARSPPVPGQPSHLYLGTTNSWIYESLDEGGSWHRLEAGRLGRPGSGQHSRGCGQPAVIFAGGWKAEQRDGGLWVSHDGGKQWKAVEALRGQSILSLAQAPSNRKILFAGTLKGVFRSERCGRPGLRSARRAARRFTRWSRWRWTRSDPKIVYAGTWHLPWKTTDGGKTGTTSRRA
jgi:hypothetical protein